jgi:hypothetical protein
MSLLLHLLSLFGLTSVRKSDEERKREDYSGMSTPDNLADAALAPFKALAAEVRDSKFPLRASGDALAKNLRWRESILSRLPSRNRAWVRFTPEAVASSAGVYRWDYILGNSSAKHEAYQQVLRGGGVGRVLQHPTVTHGCAVERVGVLGSMMAQLIDPAAKHAVDRLRNTNLYAVHQNLPIQIFNGMQFEVEGDWNRFLDPARDADGWVFDELGQRRNPSAVGGEMIWSSLNLCAPLPKQRLLGRFLGYNRHSSLWGVHKDWVPELIKAGFHVFLTADAGMSASSGFFTDGLWGYGEHGGAAFRKDNLRAIASDSEDQFRIEIDEDSGVTRYSIQGSDLMWIQSDGPDMARGWLTFQCDHSKLSEEPVFTPIGGKDEPFESLTHGWPPVAWATPSAAYGM